MDPRSLDEPAAVDNPAIRFVRVEFPAQILEVTAKASIVTRLHGVTGGSPARDLPAANGTVLASAAD